MNKIEMEELRLLAIALTSCVEGSEPENEIPGNALFKLIREYKKVKEHNIRYRKKSIHMENMIRAYLNDFHKTPGKDYIELLDKLLVLIVEGR